MISSTSKEAKTRRKQRVKGRSPRSRKTTSKITTPTVTSARSPVHTELMTRHYQVSPSATSEGASAAVEVSLPDALSSARNAAARRRKSKNKSQRALKIDQKRSDGPRRRLTAPPVGHPAGQAVGSWRAK